MCFLMLMKRNDRHHYKHKVSTRHSLYLRSSTCFSLPKVDWPSNSAPSGKYFTELASTKGVCVCVCVHACV